MDRSEVENEKSYINDFREAADAVRYAAERLDEVCQEISENLRALAKAASNSESLKIFKLREIDIIEFAKNMSPEEDLGSKMIKVLDDFLEKTEDYEDILDSQVDEDE